MVAVVTKDAPWCTPGRVFFDWYQATLPVPGADVVHTADDLAPARWDESRGSFGYESCTRFYDRDDERVLEVHYDRDQDEAHVVTSGQHTAGVVDLLRRCWPQHRVSRVDASFDLLLPGAYDEAVKVAHEQFALNGGRTSVEYSDRFSDKARTYYFGAPESSTRVVIYEKGKQKREAGIATADPNWVRVELRVRPKTYEKGFVATLTPDQVMSTSAVMRELAAHFDVRMGDRVKLPPKPASPLAFKMLALHTQYRRTLVQACAEFCGGDWDALGQLLAQLEMAESGSAKLSLLGGAHLGQNAAPTNEGAS